MGKSSSSIRTLPGEEGEIAGFPSLTYDAVTLTTPEELESRFIMLFEGDEEYAFNCQSTPDGRDEIELACDLAVDTRLLAARKRSSGRGRVATEAVAMCGRDSAPHVRLERAGSLSYLDGRWGPGAPTA